MKSGQAGATLIEVLIATVITTGVVISLSVLFPRVAKNVANNRQRAVATNLANNLIETTKAQAYTLLDPTDATKFQASNIRCDCHADDFSAVPFNTADVSGTRFKISLCVNYVASVGSAWMPACPASGDSGYKSILARIAWTQGSDSYSISQTTVKTRF